MDANAKEIELSSPQIDTCPIFQMTRTRDVSDALFAVYRFLVA
jgi:hypothetical protein